jgi:hypothetical protein
MSDNLQTNNAAMRVIRAVIAYRRGREAAGSRYPVRPELWNEVSNALDALTLIGGEKALLDIKNE